jgi:hypothetical protein
VIDRAVAKVCDGTDSAKQIMNKITTASLKQGNKVTHYLVIKGSIAPARKI